MDSDDVADLFGKMTPEESNAVLADMEQKKILSKWLTF